MLASSAPPEDEAFSRKTPFRVSLDAEGGGAPVPREAAAMLQQRTPPVFFFFFFFFFTTLKARVE